MPEMTQDRLEAAIRNHDAHNRLPYNPFSNENGPRRYQAANGDTLERVAHAMLAQANNEAEARAHGTGYTAINPIELERDQTEDFLLVQEAITKSAEEARYR